ncbi:MAG TPA: hypothetical protein VNF27_02900 [Candidatus Binataceae bacterium]|nr:hypothetical protein [Candidatus Binataceae bacterium]
MGPRDFLQDEIRAMVTNCAVCERDARDAERELGITLALDAIAHPEDAFDYDLVPHQRGRHREKLRQNIMRWAALGES